MSYNQDLQVCILAHVVHVPDSHHHDCHDKSNADLSAIAARINATSEAKRPRRAEKG